MTEVLATEAVNERRNVSPDRVGLPFGLLLLATAATAASMGLAASSVPSARQPPSVLMAMGAGSAALGMIALRSLSVQRVARAQVIVAALLAARLGVMTGGVASGRAILWVMVSLAALAIGSYIEHRHRPLLGAPGPARTTARTPGGGRWAVQAAGFVALATAAALFGGPAVARNISAGSNSGAFPGTPAAPLNRTDRIDMGNRPELGDRVLFTVRAAFPSFWRTATFDTWDGRGWSRSEDSLYALASGGRLTASPDDLAAAGGTLLEQEIRIESEGSVALPAAASALLIDSPEVAVQYRDGTLASAFPLGRGASYTVQSRVPAATEGQLRAAGTRPVPDSVTESYGQRLQASDRTRALAIELVKDAPGSFERVQAVESWLGQNTRYNLDAPLTPPGRDVVDHFLFESKEGWCEQVASASVVLLREMGVPARVAAGFTSGDPDPITGRFVVKEQNAHSWTEVWFAGIGWVPFDPTSGVRLADGGRSSSQPTSNWVDAVAIALLVIGFVLAGAEPLVRLLVATSGVVKRRRRRRQALAGRTGRSSELEALIESAGHAAGLSREPSETAAAFGARVAGRSGVPVAERAGTLADSLRYRPAAEAADPTASDSLDSRQVDLDAEIAEITSALRQSVTTSDRH